MLGLAERNICNVNSTVKSTRLLLESCVRARVASPPSLCVCVQASIIISTAVSGALMVPPSSTWTGTARHVTRRPWTERASHTASWLHQIRPRDTEPSPCSATGLRSLWAGCSCSSAPAHCCQPRRSACSAFDQRRPGRSCPWRTGC